MPKRSTKTADELDREVMKGAPIDPPTGEETEKPKADEKEQEKKEPEKKDPIAILTEQVKVLQRNLAAMEKTKPAPAPEPEEDEDETDWDKLVFENPKDAVRLIKEQTRKEIETRIKRDYDADQKKRTFWSDFYQKNPDLKDDKDLVELTMNQNLAELGDLPVEQASERIAELTRERIVRYAGGRRTTKKVEVEGSSRETGREPEPDDNNIVTLSDLIRRRKEKRRLASGKGSAA